MIERPTVFICQRITPRSETENHAMEFLRLIRKGIEVAAELIYKGFSVYCPALDLQYWLSGKYIPTAKDIYEQDISMLLKMDAIFLVGDWSASPNCCREHEEAGKANIPCFSQIDVMVNWKRQVWNELHASGKELK